MKGKTIAFLIFLVMASGITPDVSPGPWDRLAFLPGIWISETPGKSRITQDYSFILNSHFILMKTVGIFEPSEKNPKGEIHEDLAVFSYDHQRKTVVMRGFYSEGFVNTYSLVDTGDSDTLTFQSDSIENGMPGMQAKLVFEKKSDREFEQVFFVKFPEKDYSCFSRHIFTKKE